MNFDISFFLIKLSFTFRDKFIVVMIIKRSMVLLLVWSLITIQIPLAHRTRCEVHHLVLSSVAVDQVHGRIVLFSTG